MAKFTITITDEGKLAGITAAREAYNAELPSTIDDPNFVPTEENKIAPKIANPDLLETDEDYVQFVMDRAAESYSNQYKK